jgi:membrane associated rhomboid family serine protease
LALALLLLPSVTLVYQVYVHVAFFETGTLYDMRQPQFEAFPPVVKFLLIANVLLFIAQQSAFEFLLTWFALWPIGIPDLASTPGGIVHLPGFEPWQLVTYGFLHGSLPHIFFNMFALWMFGSQVENAWGSRTFAEYYFTCIIGAALTQLVVTSLSGETYPTLGASGGVFGILLAFGMMFPEQRLILLFPPIPIKAKWLVIGYGAIELWAGVTGTASGVAHFAHLGGMLFGFVLIQYWRGKLPIQPRHQMRW